MKRTPRLQHVRKEFKETLRRSKAYYEKERELSYQTGWGNFSEAKGNRLWLDAYIEEAAAVDAGWKGSAAEYLIRMAKLVEEVKPDEDYKRPNGARSKVRSAIERLERECSKRLQTNKAASNGLKNL